MTEEQNNSIRKTVEKESEGLLGFIRKRVPDPDEARDILQDTFYQLVVNYENIENLNLITSWLYSVARNRIIDRSRKKKPQNDLDRSFTLNEEGETLYLADIIPSLEPGPEQEMIQSAIWEEIELAINELPENQKEVFIMHEFEDRSFKEIAELTGVNMNTLLSRKRQAVLFLREKLQELFNQLNF